MLGATCWVCQPDPKVLPVVLTEQALCYRTGTEPTLVFLAAFFFNEHFLCLLKVNFPGAGFFCCVFQYFLLGHSASYWHKECLWNRHGERLYWLFWWNSDCLPCSALHAVAVGKLLLWNTVMLWEGKKVNAFFPPLVCLSPYQLHTIWLLGRLLSRGEVSEGRSVVGLKGELSVWACSLVLCCIELSQLCLFVALGCVFFGRLWCWEYCAEVGGFLFFFLPLTAQFVDQNRWVFFLLQGREASSTWMWLQNATQTASQTHLVWRQCLSPLTQTKRCALAVCYALFSRNTLL